MAAVINLFHRNTKIFKLEARAEMGATTLSIPVRATVVWWLLLLAHHHQHADRPSVAESPIHSFFSFCAHRRVPMKL